jgi:phage recombination protein Bet
MSNEILVLNAEKISRVTGYQPEEIAIIKNTVAKNTTDSELAYFVNVAKSTGLNPFNKEIWCYKDNKSNLLVFTGRDGFLSKAQSNPKFNGIRSSEVRDDDEFMLDIANNNIKHIKNHKSKSKIIGAYAIAFRKDGEPTIEWADFDTYNKTYNVWKANPAEMIKKVAESHALKKGFGISGVQSEYDYEVKNEVVTPINTTLSVLEQKKEEITILLDSYTGEDKEYLREQCVEATKNGTFDEKLADEILRKIK